MQKAETGCYTFCDEPVGCRIYNANWQQQKSIMLQEGSEKTKCPLCIGIHHENIYSQQIEIKLLDYIYFINVMWIRGYYLNNTIAMQRNNNCQLSARHCLCPGKT